MKTRLRHYLALMAMAALFAAALAGCNGDAVTAETDTNDPLAPPAFTEIAEVISLDDSQGETIKAALTDWREASAGQSRGRGEGRQALLKDFIAEVALSLETEKLAALVVFVVDHQESRMEAMRGKTQGRRGGARHGRGHGGGQGGGMFAELDLTGEQQTAMKEARDAMRETMKALHEQFREGAITEEELHAQAQAAREAMKAAVAEILTEEQLAKLEELQAERMTERLERRLENLGSRIDEKLEFMAAVLDLTEAQQAAIRTIMETAVEDEKAIIQSILAGETSHEDGRTALHDLRAATREAIEAELTEDQLARLEALRPLKRGPKHHR